MLVTIELQQVQIKAKQSRIDAYQRNLRSAVRGLWSSVLDFDQFFSAMNSAITRGLTGAWHEGALECGIKPDELSIEEEKALSERIVKERSYIADFGEVIEANSKTNKGQLTPLFGRLNTWTNRYLDITNEAKIIACADQKLVWRLGATEQHCKTCPRLHGRVKRASYWNKVGIRPQNPPNPAIECGGWRCKCTLEITNEPISKGPLPR
jgi:hypothetical protein